MIVKQQKRGGGREDKRAYGKKNKENQRNRSLDRAGKFLITKEKKKRC